MTEQRQIDIIDAEVVNVPSRVQSPSSMLAVIERVALDPAADVAKLERMLDMKERLDDRAREDARRDAERQFYADLVAAQSAIPVVVKNRKNTFNNTAFADLAAIEDAAMPIIRQHGFSVSAKSVPGADDGSQRIIFRVAHRLGHVDEFQDDFPLDNQGTGGKASKTNIQAKGSTVTYARRYMLCAYFNIAIADSDGAPKQTAPAAPVELSAAQAKRLRDLIASTATDEAKFLASAKSESIEAIRPADFARLEQLLVTKAQRAAQTPKE